MFRTRLSDAGITTRSCGIVHHLASTICGVGLRSFNIAITKPSPCHKDPLTPHFYIVKLGLTWVYIFSFLFFCFKWGVRGSTLHGHVIMMK